MDRPGEYDIDQLLRIADQEERVYRLRCVEGWSMVIPWMGVPLATLIKRFQPTSRARHKLPIDLLRADILRFGETLETGDFH